MCTASLDKGYSWNSAKNNTDPSQKKQVRFAFAMKLPLFSCQKVVGDDENNAISIGWEYGEEEAMTAAVRQQAQSTRGVPPSPNNAALIHVGGGMRRVKSANASRPRGAVGAASGMDNNIPKSRSHSQESRPRNAVYEVAPTPPPSEQLPIPQCKNRLLEIARKNSDQTDLRRMYDYATWNMYDRIVSARNKKRLSEQENMDELDSLNKEGEQGSSPSASKYTDKTSPVVSTTATTSCNSSFSSSPNPAAIACKGSGIIKTSGNNNKTTATIKKVQASTSSNTTNTTSASATATATQATSTASFNQQQAATTSSATTNKHATQTSLHYKLRSIKKSFSSHDTDSSQGGGTAATVSTSTESEYSSGSSSGCNSPATLPGFMMASGRSHRTMSQGSEDDHFIFQMDM
mmetsp:Transcript_18185/g.29815  ORF Transcript_18185/g.29815 Transcript_18185/m.29815 type:complete len:405 (-) Transcript_18185:253-1467(-)|eukprot:scaffold619_cov150-Skeletonema_menzelii.AAC.4